MALNFLLKRTVTASKRPVAASMAFGELDINYDSTTGGVFYKDSANVVTKIGPVEVGTTAPNATPVGSAGNSRGEQWYDSTNGLLKTYNGSAFVNPVPNGSTTVVGILQLTDSISSTSTTTAATPNSVKTAYDLANAAIPKSTVTAKGNIVTATASSTPTALPVGTNGQILTANSACTTGLAWVTSAQVPANYGSFLRTTTQTNVGGATGQAAIFDTTVASNNFSVVGGTQITAAVAGTYTIVATYQVAKTDTGTDDINVWFKKNGTNVPASNSKFGIPQRKSAGDPSHMIAALNFFIALEKNDYVQLAWRPSNIGVSIEHFATATTPTRPATPSIIATVSYLSSNGYTSNLFTEAYISAQTNGSATISHPANTVAGKTYKYVIVG